MDGFIGEIRVFPWNWTPDYWLPCNGQTVSMNQYQALGSLIAGMWGSYTTSTFVLPNLNGNILIGSGQGPGLTSRTAGQMVGAAQVTLSSIALPPHTHTLNFAGTGRSAPTNMTAKPSPTAIPAQEVTVMTTFSTNPADSYMDPTMIGVTGTAAALQPHANLQPSLVMQFYICWQGEYPVPAN